MSTSEELETYIEKWVYFIKHAADLETIPEKLDEPVFHLAFDQANRANMTAKELEAYDNSVTVMMDERGRIEGAFEMGEKSGLKSGLRQAARAMKQKNMQADLIAELTGLSITEVESLI